MANNKVAVDEVDKFFEYNLFIPSRTIFMGSLSESWEGGETGVNYAMAEYVIKGLHILERLAPKPPANNDITILLNNPGGDWYHGMAIYDAIQACEANVTIRTLGHAMSMGSIILQAADDRVMSPNSRLMIHYGTSGFHNHTKIVQQWAKEDKKLIGIMEEIYMDKIKLKHPTFPGKKLRDMLNFDTILNAEEAVNLGLADRIE